MNFLSRSVLLFTPTVVVIAFGSFVWFCHSLNPIALFAFLLTIYGLPVIAYRCHQHFFPIQEGITYINDKEVSHWWISSQLQSLYFTFPVLETVLRLIPGLFSFWLRFWGAKIGKGVYWTPQIAIADRGLIEIGDHVFFGNWVVLVPHAATPKKNQLRLYVKKIYIGDHAFIGGWSRLGPGVVLEKGSVTNANSDVYPNQKVKNEQVESKPQTQLKQSIILTENPETSIS